MDKSPVVSFRKTTKSYGARPAIKDVSFDISSGRVVGLLGRNGAGKSTLMRTLLGLTQADSGSALLWGLPYADAPQVASRVGVLMDTMTAIPGSTGRSELRLWTAALGLADHRADEVLEIVELSDAANERVRSYSTGMRQRLGLAVALLTDPELLVLDEPTNGLDPEGVRWLRVLVRRLAAEGRTVLLSSHQLAEVERTVDDVVVLEKTVRFVGTLEDFVDGEATLEDRFFEVIARQEVSIHAYSS
ncbi:MAG: ABC transporter ATP-binding protein [Actinomycetales bacterium]|nr:MAG: ABC transporter ATP-binding protein [Actinomycetales bacterium]